MRIIISMNCIHRRTISSEPRQNIPCPDCAELYALRLVAATALAHAAHDPILSEDLIALDTAVRGRRDTIPMPPLVRCSCGRVAPSDRFARIGVQRMGDGEYAELGNCPHCLSTVCTRLFRKPAWAIGTPTTVPANITEAVQQAAEGRR